MVRSASLLEPVGRDTDKEGDGTVTGVEPRSCPSPMLWFVGTGEMEAFTAEKIFRSEAVVSFSAEEHNTGQVQVSKSPTQIKNNDVNSKKKRDDVDKSSKKKKKETLTKGLS